MWVSLCVLVVPVLRQSDLWPQDLVISLHTDDCCTFSISKLDYYNNIIGSNIRTFLTILY